LFGIQPSFYLLLSSAEIVTRHFHVKILALEPHSPLLSSQAQLRAKSRTTIVANMKKVEFSLPPIAEKVTSIFHPRKNGSPVFNQPLNTSSCPHHRISRLLYSIFLTLLLIIAIPVITLKAMTHSFIEDNRMMGFNFETTEKDGEPGVMIVMAALPKMLYPVPAKLALVASAISILLGVAHLGFVSTDWKNGKRVRTTPRACE
jgi:hypothetical protein